MNSIVRSLFAITIGLLLVFLKESAMPFMVRLVGVAFFLPALVSIINVYVTRKGAPLLPMALMSVVDIGSMAFGAWLMFFPLTFLELFVVLMAVLLLGFSLFQAFVVLSLRNAGVRWGLLVVPLVLAVASVIMLSNPFGTISTASLVLGIAIAASGFSDLFIYLLLGKGVRGSLQKRS